MEFDNRANCLVDFNLLLNAIEWYSGEEFKPIAPYQSRIYKDARGYAFIFIKKGIKLRVHRIIIMYLAKRKFKKGISIHHINENKLDNRAVNLRPINAKKHYPQYHSKWRE